MFWSRHVHGVLLLWPIASWVINVVKSIHSLELLKCFYDLGGRSLKIRSNACLRLSISHVILINLEIRVRYKFFPPSSHSYITRMSTRTTAVRSLDTCQRWTALEKCQSFCYWIDLRRASGKKLRETDDYINTICINQLKVLIYPSRIFTVLTNGNDKNGAPYCRTENVIVMPWAIVLSAHKEQVLIHELFHLWSRLAANLIMRDKL